MTAAVSADVVIVGGGLLGLATARALRGERDVLVLEQATVGHARGGSHGATRIFRLGYADPHYVEMAQRAAECWRAITTRRMKKRPMRWARRRWCPSARCVAW